MYRYQVNDISVYLGRGGEGFPIERTNLRPYLVSATSAGVSNVHKVKNVPLLV